MLQLSQQLRPDIEQVKPALREEYADLPLPAMADAMERDLDEMLAEIFDIDAETVRLARPKEISEASPEKRVESALETSAFYAVLHAHDLLDEFVDGILGRA